MTRTERQRRRKALTDELLRKHRMEQRYGIPVKGHSIGERVKTFKFCVGDTVADFRHVEGRVTARRRSIVNLKANNEYFVEWFHPTMIHCWCPEEVLYGPIPF